MELMAGSLEAPFVKIRNEMSIINFRKEPEAGMRAATGWLHQILR